MPSTLENKLSISDLFRGDQKLASPPNIYFELQKIIDDPLKALVDIAFVIEKDPSLALSLLKIVNSAFYGFPSQIASVDRAINLIGSKEIQNIVLSTAIIEKFSELPGELISMHDFWARSLRCALIAQGIDSYLDKEFSESVFVCGMLHNIGQLVLFRCVPELAREVNLMIQAIDNPTDSDEIEAEENVIGFDHYKVGASLTKRWKLPDVITNSIKLHAYPDNTEIHHKIASIVRLADCYSKMDSFAGDLTIDNLGISSLVISEIIDNAYEEFEEIFKFFYKVTGNK